MNLQEYVPLAIRTEKPLAILERMGHSCMGLITELGEVTTELKRMAIYGKLLDAERKVHILEEIGDVMWYLAIMWSVIDADLDQLSSCPKFEPPNHIEGMYEATALMLGGYCGQICAITQDVIAHTNIDEDHYSGIMSSSQMILIGMTLLAEHCGSTIGMAMADNIVKLRVRFPDAYSNEAAEGRADKGGVDARNS
jgi:hypothetical protein